MSILIDMVTLPPIYLCLDSGFCLISENCLCSFLRSNLSYVVFDNRVMSSEALFLYLSKYPSCTEWIFVDPLLDILPERVKYTRLLYNFPHNG